MSERIQFGIELEFCINNEYKCKSAKSLPHVDFGCKINNEYKNKYKKNEDIIIGYADVIKDNTTTWKLVPDNTVECSNYKTNAELVSPIMISNNDNYSIISDIVTIISDVNVGRNKHNKTKRWKY